MSLSMSIYLLDAPIGVHIKFFAKIEANPIVGTAVRLI